ncbi:phage tail protein [Klebsiella aerogenes]|uniref:phage tail protein n=1 Tax=Klebsiella aerogenes TaxID=548 RepID=UPI000E2FE67D|nr:phage tail protein [Klebsiella aerogenes]EKV3392710.1 phage tail protein [Klebsiella aerogenes]WPS48744.1 phage tail protein [Klebsiella aerogenes]WPS50835.1 phage tail protein [Klebsiella aerogenes]
MSQTQLENLTAFFQANVPPRAMQSFDSVLDEMEFIPAARDLGLGQYRQAVIRYDAVLSWARFPYRLCPPQLLMSLLAAWLDEADRELLDEIGVTEADPQWDVSVEDEETATVVLSVPMAEELVIKQDENGAIPWRGERWSLVNPEIWTAIYASVYGVDEAGAPIGVEE